MYNDRKRGDKNKTRVNYSYFVKLGFTQKLIDNRNTLRPIINDMT